MCCNKRIVCIHKFNYYLLISSQPTYDMYLNYPVFTVMRVMFLKIYFLFFLFFFYFFIYFFLTRISETYA